MTTIRPTITKDGKITPIYEAARVVRKDHAMDLAIEITRRAELSQWLEDHAKPGVRGWFHRLRHVRTYRAFVREANFRQSRSRRRQIVREATVLFLAPGRDVANSLAAVFTRANERRAATALQKADLK